MANAKKLISVRRSPVIPVRNASEANVKRIAPLDRDAATMANVKTLIFARTLTVQTLGRAGNALPVSVNINALMMKSATTAPVCQLLCPLVRMLSVMSVSNASAASATRYAMRKRKTASAAFVSRSQ